MQQLITKSYASKIEDLDEKGIVTVAANAFGNVDDSKDISLKGSFTKTITEGMNRLKWYLNHDQSILLGVPLEASQTDQHLVVKGQINLNKQIGRDTYEDYKMYAEHGKTLEHSIGAYAVKSRKNEAGHREVSEWKWMEYSTLTNWGANENTPLLSLKSTQISDPFESILFMELCLKKANYSDAKGKQIENQIAVLKALISEPSADTPILEPQDAAFDIKSIISSELFKI